LPNSPSPPLSLTGIRLLTAETHEPVGLVAEQLRGMATTELEVDDGVGRGQCHLVGTVRPAGVGAVTTVDNISALAALGVAINVDITP
jgi:hypothetical protein